MTWSIALRALIWRCIPLIRSCITLIWGCVALVWSRIALVRGCIALIWHAITLILVITLGIGAILFRRVISLAIARAFLAGGSIIRLA